jgi:hypothetical protein
VTSFPTARGILSGRQVRSRRHSDEFRAAIDQSLDGIAIWRRGNAPIRAVANGIVIVMPEARDRKTRMSVHEIPAA